MDHHPSDPPSENPNLPELPLFAFCKPQAPAPPGLPFSQRALRFCIANNIFYALSAIVFLFGCKALMRSPQWRENEFLRIFYNFAVLQGYEVLVLASAAFIARRLFKLSDGFMLCCIGLVLLLDPTAFNNNFISLLPMERGGPAALFVCVAACLFIPIKLHAIQRITHMRLSRAAWAGLLLTGLFIYFSALPFNLAASFGAGVAYQRFTYYYALAWFPGLLALVFPRVAGASRVLNPPTADFATPRQLAMFPRFVVILPLASVVWHFVEHASIYALPFPPFMFAPLIFGLGLLLFRQLTPEQRQEALLPLFDAFNIFACLLTLRPVDTQAKYIFAQHLPGDTEYVNQLALIRFSAAHYPLLWCGLAALALYLLFWLRHRGHAALVRIGLIAAAALIYAFKHVGWLDGLVAWFGRHPQFFFWAFWLALTYGLLRVRSFAFVLLYLAYSLPLFATLLPHGLAAWLPEVIECELALLFMHRTRSVPRETPGKFMLAVFIALLAAARMNAHPHLVYFLMPCLWSALGLAWAIHRLLPVLGAQALLLGGYTGCAIAAHNQWPLRPELLLLGFSLVLFAVGLITTFKKDRLLDRLTPPPPPPEDPPPTHITSAPAPDLGLAH